MRATKETCQQAIQALEEMNDSLGLDVTEGSWPDVIMTFLRAAKKVLPSGPPKTIKKGVQRESDE